MYSEIPQGSCHNIQGLSCWVPPEGYVYNVFTKQIEQTGVYSRSDIESEQYWERFPYPSWYKDVLKRWDEYDEKKKEDDPEFFDEKLEQFKKQEWFRRLNGFWFMNNGKPTYLTGTHYYFLQYWTLDTGVPKFRMPDLEKAYFMQYCIEDPLCLGMVEVTKRRFGKSFWAGLFLVEYISRTKMAFGGIQSKTGKDASKFFGKTVVNPFRRLPKFFRPEYDTGLGANPKSEIRFQKTNIRGKNARINVGKEELGGGIDHQPSDKVAYDGQKLLRYVADECGKTIEEDIYERHEVVRYCLMDDEGRVIGKALYTTTVEKIDTDRDGVQEAFKTLWDESNQENRNELGMTGTGLYRFFMSAKKTRNIDVYGFPDEQKTLEALLKERAEIKNPRSLAARIRKEPITIEEAFYDDGDKCVFNIINILERERELRDNPVFKREIIFFMDEEIQKVKWRDASKTEKDFCWRLSEHAELGNFPDNKSHKDGPLLRPSRTRDGAISVDSYANSQGGRKYGSKASAWIGRKLDVMNQDKTGKAVGHLYGRPSEKDELHRQVMLAAIFFGYEVFYEHTADDYYTYFRDRGKLGYLGLYPISLIDTTKRNKENLERHRGTPITPFALTKELDNAISYFEKYPHKIDFEELLQWAKKFDPYNRTESDAVVSFLILISVLGEKAPTPPPKRFPLVQLYNANGQVIEN